MWLQLFTPHFNFCTLLDCWIHNFIPVVHVHEQLFAVLGERGGLKKQLRSPWTYLNKPHLPWLLADPGKARGCSTNTIVIHSFINSLGHPLVKIYFLHRHAQMVSKNYVWPQKKISNFYLKNGDLSPTEPSSSVLKQDFISKRSFVKKIALPIIF